jgi:hypothetical protein
MKDIVIKPLIELLLYFLGLVLFEWLDYLNEEQVFLLLFMGFLAALRFRIIPQYEKNKKDKPQA